MHQQSPQALSLSVSSYPMQNLIVLGRIGRGATSHVFQVQSTLDKQMYAMKVFDKKGKTFSTQALKRQLKIQEGLKHPNILQLISHVQDTDNHYVFTDYCSGGQLTNKLKTTLPQSQLANITRQIAEGLLYLHQQGIAHCDLKLSNILFQQSGVKICDFGFSRRIEQSHCQKLCGTIFYLSPQIVREKKRSYFRQADVWALGICLLILITKKQPYNGQNYKEISEQILKGERTSLPPLSPELESLMAQLLDPIPQTRITLALLLNHPFLSKYSESKNGSDVETTKIEEKTVANKKNSKDNKEHKGKQEQKQEEPEPKWTFKRTVKTNESSSNLTQKKKLTQVSSNDLTIKLSKRSKQSLFLYKQEQHDQTVTLKKKKLPRIDTRLVSPLSYFRYQTKNDGFVQISKEGNLTLKVKSIVFSVTDQGNTLTIGDKYYLLQQINTHKQSLVQPYELYSYALNIISILKNKAYDRETSFQFKGQEVVMARAKSGARWVILATIQQQKVILQFNLKRAMMYRFEDQEWRSPDCGVPLELQTLIECVTSRIEQQ